MHVTYIDSSEVSKETVRLIGIIFENDRVQYQTDDSVERELVGHFDNGLADGGRTGLAIVLIE